MSPKRIALTLWGILAVSLALRVYLVYRGGAFYWPDEFRYLASRQLFEVLSRGEIEVAILGLSHAPDHIGFKLLGLIPAALESAFGVEDPRLAALTFCWAPVACIWLVWRIALRAGAGRVEALLAATLLALSTSFVYYARHIFPYDLSMAAGLVAVWIAMGKPDEVRAFLCGMIASACFLIYNGYFTLAGVAMGICWLRPPWNVRDLLRRGTALALGFGAPIWALATIAALAGGDLLAAFGSFSGTILQGEFSEGWSLPVAYLWHAEHGLLLFWIVCIGYCASKLLGASPTAAHRRVATWLGAVLGIYFVLFFGSVVLERFVVYGRLARQMVPFLCLLGAYTLERLRTLRPARPRLAVVLGLLAVQASYNLYQPVTQVFTAEFLRAAARAQRAIPGSYALVYPEHFYPEPERRELPPHEVVLSARHPLQYLPNQYEGFTPSARRAMRSIDISMRLIRTKPEPARPVNAPR